MLVDYLPVLLFLVLGAVFVPLNLLIGSLIRPRINEPDKYAPYECGEESEGHLFNQFNPRFYVIALIFVIFEALAAESEPPNTVKSWAKTCTRRPSILP